MKLIINKILKPKNNYRLFFVIILILGLAGFSLFKSRFFWTPDLIGLVLLIIFAILGQPKKFLKYFGPFILLLLAYEKLRSLVPFINHRVNFSFMIDFDRWLFGGILPTAWLQEHFYGGHVRWFEFYLYFIYMLHFIIPVVLAVIIWKKRIKLYWIYVNCLIILSFSAFLTYLAFPAAPPWMASEQGYIKPITRISSDVWWEFGVKDFSSFYKKLTPNTVAAVPSLHSAYPLVFSLFILKIWRRKWFMISLIYPISVWYGVVYMGEHYVFDVLTGVIYALVAYRIAPIFYTWQLQLINNIKMRLNYAGS